MTTEKFSEALGNIAESYVDEAVTYTAKKKANPWVKWASLAACLSLIVLGVIFGNVFRSPDNSISSYFVITAHAANGDLTELRVDEKCFNSTISQDNIFGVRMPLFNFFVRPSDMKSNEEIYSRFDIIVSYNGTRVEDKDEHILVTNTIPAGIFDDPWGYSVSGWFDKPTNIIVNIVDKDSREIVETIAVNVKYDADRKGYDLEIVNLSDMFEDQKAAADANNALMEYFFNQGYVSDYPAYFGGCYIEDNKLYVKLVYPTDEEMKSLTNVLARYGAAVVFEEAEASMADLQKYADRIAGELKDNGYAVTMWCVDSISGNIKIAVLEEDLEAVKNWISDMSKNKNLPTVIIEEGAYFVLD